MPRYYRALLATFLAGALAAPAVAQTPAPMAHAAPAAPAGAEKATTPVKAGTHKHRHVVHAKTAPQNTAAKPDVPPPAAVKN